MLGGSSRFARFSVDVDEIAHASRDYEGKVKVKNTKSRVSLNMLMKIMILSQYFEQKRQIPHSDSKGDMRGKSEKKGGPQKMKVSLNMLMKIKGEFCHPEVSLIMLMKTNGLSCFSDYVIEKKQLNSSRDHQFCGLELFADDAIAAGGASLIRNSIATCNHSCLA